MDIGENNNSCESYSEDIKICRNGEGVKTVSERCRSISEKFDKLFVYDKKCSSDIKVDKDEQTPVDFNEDGALARLKENFRKLRVNLGREDPKEGDDPNECYNHKLKARLPLPYFAQKFDNELAVIYAQGETQQKPDQAQAAMARLIKDFLENACHTKHDGIDYSRFAFHSLYSRNIESAIPPQIRIKVYKCVLRLLKENLSVINQNADVEIYDLRYPYGMNDLKKNNRDPDKIIEDAEAYLHGSIANVTSSLPKESLRVDPERISQERFASASRLNQGILKAIWDIPIEKFNDLIDKMVEIIEGNGQVKLEVFLVKLIEFFSNNDLLSSYSRGRIYTKLAACNYNGYESVEQLISKFD